MIVNKFYSVPIFDASTNANILDRVRLKNYNKTSKKVVFMHVFI